MSEFACIYCLEHFPEPGSQEHIIPYALGGSNQLLTHLTCESCNNNLGSSIDAKLAIDLLILSRRNALGIKSQSGKIPAVTLQGNMGGGNNKGSLSIPSHGKPLLEITPNVASKTTKDTETFEISGTKEEVRPILEKKLERLSKKGFSTDRSIDELMSAAITQETIHGQTPIDLTILDPGFAKIGLAFGSYVFGRAWAKSSLAGILRSFMNEGGSPPKYLCSSDYRELVVGNEDKNSDDHILAFLPGESLKFLVSLFGRNTHTAVIDLGPFNFLDHFEKLCECSAVIVDPSSRSVTRIGVLELNHRSP